MTITRMLPAPAPIVYPEAKPYWDATLRRRLLLPRCDSCHVVIWYPRASCPKCASSSVSWFEASGRGRVYSYTICRRGADEYREAGAFVLAYVELAEGPRVMTNIVECDPEKLSVGAEVEAVFHPAGDKACLLRFRPIVRLESSIDAT